MKNIYDDSNERLNMEDISSGKEDNAEPAQPFTAPRNAPSFEKRKAPSQAQGQQGTFNPQLQLTKEQVAALLSQLIGSEQIPAEQPKPTQPAPKAPASASGNDSGKRILYQSPDFDDAGKSQEPAELPTARFDEQMKRSFYDDDELFDSEEARKSGLRAASGFYSGDSKIKTTELGKSFSVDEIEYDNNDLPQIKPMRVTDTPMSKAPQTKSGYTVEEEDIVEEIEIGSLKPASRPDTSKKAEPRSDTFKKAEPERTFVPSIEIEDIEEVSSSEMEKPKKKLPVSEIVRRVVLGISLVAIVLASAVLVHEYFLHKQNQEVENDVKNLIVDVAETTKVKKKDKDKSDKKLKETEKATEPQLTPEQQWAQIRAEYPNVIFPPNTQLKYAKLYAENQDFVGYLSAEGVNLSLPVVQTDNDEDYMTKNFYGKTTKYGCPFVTHVNNIQELDMNTVIFGHHMNDGTVFGALDAYKTIDGFKKAPVITFNTLYKDYQWKVIAAFITNAYEQEDNGYVFKYYFASLSTQERFAAYLNELAQRSLYDTGVDVLPTDKLLTLSTCSHEFNEARMVVVARLVRPGESTDVDVNKATVNSNPRYPQAYYTKKKQTNPYLNASKWEVE